MCAAGMALAVKAVLDAVMASPDTGLSAPLIRAALSHVGEHVTIRQTAQCLRRCGLRDDAIAAVLRALLGAIAVSVAFF